MNWRREQLHVYLSQNNVYFIIQEMLESPLINKVLPFGEQHVNFFKVVS